MASRIVQQQQARGEAVVGGGKQQKKNGVADGRNRKALGDIGNLANVRGVVDAKPNRPITRSFGAQLLANAQAAAAADNSKRQACANVAGPPAVANEGVAVAKRAAPKPVSKKVIVKPKPSEKVTDIDASPDKKEVLKDKKKEGDANPKKKSQHTLTSVLTARSKAACGITNKPKEQIIDIDASDVDNELAAVEYIDDIYKFYKLVENESRPHDYIGSQPEINERMRAILVDWLIDVHTKFELSLETLYLTINIIDRFLAVKTVPRRELQLVGISAMLMASKYEEIWPPEVNDFVCLSDRAYTHEHILTMEKTILNKLEWTLTVPTPLVFLVRFIKASVPDQEVNVVVLDNMAHFLSELGMMNYATLMYCPSMVAASAVLAARCTLNKAPFWNETLKLHTGYSQEQLMDCARLLVGFHSTLENGKLRVVYRKYSDPQKGAVAVLPPAKFLLPEGSASQHS
ncbi:G2/mitotic-specific cyclin S13-6 isoform X1 [Glycine soja]|uniref:G2/mitotic-specific cyclin S13-6 isoform X1 n=1 Tax=Glycine soja TaxID=3848 RepID=UPI00103B114D|nr:G2/mitotic-specific cyclin S13-6 isoform X1 [Glycine soja]